MQMKALKQAFGSFESARRDDVLESKAITPDGLIPNRPEIVTAILNADATAIPVVGALKRLVLDRSKVKVQIGSGTDA